MSVQTILLLAGLWYGAAQSYPMTPHSLLKWWYQFTFPPVMYFDTSSQQLAIVGVEASIPIPLIFN